MNVYTIYPLGYEWRLDKKEACRLGQSNDDEQNLSTPLEVWGKLGKKSMVMQSKF